MLNPTVSAGVNAGLKKQDVIRVKVQVMLQTTEIEPGRKMPDPLGNFAGGITASWEVDIWKKLRTEKESAIAHYLSTVEGKNFVLSSLIEEVADSYYELLALDNQLDITREYIKLQERALEISKFRNRHPQQPNWL